MSCVVPTGTSGMLFAVAIVIQVFSTTSLECISIPLDNFRYWRACLMHYEKDSFHSISSLKDEIVKGIDASMIPIEPLTKTLYKHLDSRRDFRDGLQAEQYQRKDNVVKGIVISKIPRRLESENWYKDEWERDYMKSSASAILIFVAALFEVLYHKFHNLASKTYQYGQFMMTKEEKKVAKKRAVFGHPLMVVFIDRMGAEFMVLGFLAFCIWALTQLGFLEWMASLPSSTRSPTTGAQYTHLLEDQHMQLFLTMCLYFVLAARMVQGSNAEVQEFEAQREQWITQLLKGVRDSSVDDDSDESLKSFKRWRRMFLDEDRGAVNTIFNWREKNPDAFKRVLQSLHVEQDPSTLTLQEFKIEFDVHFSFCTYVSFSVCGAVGNMVEMKGLAMFVILCLKVLLAISHRLFKTNDAHFQPSMVFMAAVYIFSIHLLSHVFKTALDHKEYRPLPGWASYSSRFERKMGDYPAFKTLQVILFFLCYSMAGSFMKFEFWRELIARDVWTICIFLFSIFTYLALIVDLPRCLPAFAAVMSLPPFFGEQDEDMVELVAAQVVDTRMIAAREHAQDFALQAFDRGSRLSIGHAERARSLMLVASPPMFDDGPAYFSEGALHTGALHTVTKRMPSSLPERGEVEMGHMQQPLRAPLAS